jgi:putative DNA primase/helicase
VAALHCYVVLPTHEARAIALWVLHTYLFSIFTCTPRLAITSPERRCGKTTLMDVLAGLLPRVLSVAGISAAAIFRTVELVRPTLLIDEADTFLPQNEELRGVLNSGHRRGGTSNMVRLVGDNHEPRQFSTHTPVAVAMIGKLPGTLADRSIPIQLRRRRSDEVVQSFRADRTEDLDRLASMAARWAIDNEAAIQDADPEIDRLFNRDADNWRPLLAIADAAGGHWPASARQAARALVAIGAADNESTGAMLFADIRAAFETRGGDRISSEELVAYLHGCEDRPWPEFGKSGKPISKAQLARLLRQFRICSGTVRLGERTFKGYLRKDFEDAFERYIDPRGRFEPSQRHTPRAARDSADSKTSHEEAM